MHDFDEQTRVSTNGDGFIAISVVRTYRDGIVYRSALFFASGDVAAVADALERFAATRRDQSLALADGTLRIFHMPPSEMINLELERAERVPHGGYDTLDLAPGSAADVASALRAGQG
jgi:hypothetical protein